MKSKVLGGIGLLLSLGGLIIGIFKENADKEELKREIIEELNGEGVDEEEKEEES